MLARESGRFINVTSSFGPAANLAAYSCAKGAVTMFTAVLALELVGTGVVTFALSPLAATDMVQQGLDSSAITEEQRAYLTALLDNPGPLLADSLRLLRIMLSGRLDHVPGSCLLSYRPLESQLARLSEH
jgi:NAD(P)-dependent dehydrogenase (short-subunit alcohol dehydrogenase family)